MFSRWSAPLLMSVAVMGLVAILYLVSSTILADGFTQLERQDTRQQVERAVDALAAELESLDSKTGDWANWDDTYAFVEDGNPNFIKTNTTDTSFIQLQVDAMVFVHSSGRLVFAKAFDLDTEQSRPVPSGLLAALGPQSPLLQHPDIKSSLTGILVLPEGPLLVASRPILTGNGEGPSRGVLLFGRFLDAHALAKLSETTHLSLTLHRLTDPSLPADFQSAVRTLSASAGVFVRAIDETSIAGYKILQDINGVPSYILRVDLPRAIYAQGQTSTRYLLASLVVIGLVLGTVVSALAAKLTNDIARRKRVEGELREARDRLEQQVVERTAELTRVNQSLQDDVAERERAQVELQQATNDLKRSVNELEQRSREITLLNDLGDVLQTCVTSEEAHLAVARFGPQLFPDQVGALCITSPSRSLVDAAAVWGELAPAERVFAPDQCWALRRGQIYAVPDTGSGLVCRHVHPPLPIDTLCVPMMAQGETLGILHLRSLPGSPALPDEERAATLASRQRLAVALAERIGLAMMNLHLRETLSNQAIRDPLTGLFNRRYMEETLERELRRAARRGVGLGVVMLDLDHFKEFNDTYGHGAGDAALRELGAFLRTHIRVEDIACRYGGEEFILILPEAAPSDVLKRAEQLRLGLKQLDVEYRGQSLRALSVSLGVAHFPEHGSTVETIVQAADAALYRAKHAGRDQIVSATIQP